MDVVYYDKKGKPLCYCDDGIHIFSFDGKPLAYINDEDIYSFPGRHLGWLKDGWIRDHQGQCVLFSELSRGGPGLPGKMGVPGKSGKFGLPGKGGRDGRQSQPGFNNNWSSATSQELFR